MGNRPVIDHPRLLERVTVVAIVGHACIVLLYGIERAVPAIPPRLPEIRLAGSHWTWAILHAITALLLTAGLTGHYLRRHTERLLAWTCCFSAMLSAVWSLLLLVWAFFTPVPITLLGPAIVLLVLAPIGAVCGRAWTDKEA